MVRPAREGHGPGRGTLLSPREPYPPAWIETVPEESAGGELRELYSRVADPRSGRVDHVLRAHSLHEEGLRAHFQLYVASMKSTPGLRKVDREMVAVLVSKLNGCHY